MFITNNTIRHSAKYFLLSLGLTLVACGGGGGGSSYPSIQYTGETNQATVDETNAADFPVTMLEGSTGSSSTSSFVIGSSTTNPDNTAPQSAQHTAMLNIVAEQIKNNVINLQNNSDSNIVSAVTNTGYGTCPENPGSLSVTNNSTQTNLNASFTFNNFCIGDINISYGSETVLNGKINVTGLYDSSTGIIFNMTMSVEYLKLTVRTDTGTAIETFSEEFSGAMTATFDGSPSNIIVSMTLTTNFQANGLTYKVQDLVVDTSSGLAISGRFYHPTHGFVDVTTTKNFSLYSTNPDKYCGGSLRITGNGGVVEFTANVDCTQYSVTFTATGNTSGTPDYEPGFVAWP